MARTIRELLGALPNGGFTELSWLEVGSHLKKNYLDNMAEKGRRDRAKKRRDFYRDGGEDHIKRLLEQVFENELVKDLRRRFVALAKYNNVTKRIVNTVSTIYAAKPERSLPSTDEQKKYKEVLDRCKQDLVMRRFDRLLYLHRYVLLGFRVDTDEPDNLDAERRPVLDVVEPDQFWRIRHPLDRKRTIGIILDMDLQGPKVIEAEKPAYLVWTDHEHFKIDKSGRIIESTVTEHGFERMPWILATFEAGDSVGCEDQSGEDLVAAHQAVWFQNVNFLKESKSKNKQAIFSGDLGDSARGQAADSEVDVELADGVNVQTIDRGVDLSAYLKAADAIIDTVAANYNIPPSVIRGHAASSGHEIELRRIGIKEQRQEHEPVVRDVEGELVEIEAMVLERDLPALAFDPTGWSVRFRHVEAPRSPTEENQIFEQERRLGLTDTFAEVSRREGINEEQAIAVVIRRVANELLRNALMRPLMELNGGMGADMAAGASPEENGTEGIAVKNLLGRLELMDDPRDLRPQDLAALEGAVKRLTVKEPTPTGGGNPEDPVTAADPAME